MSDGIRKVRILGSGAAYSVRLIGPSGEQEAEWHYRKLVDAIRKAREFPEYDLLEQLLPYLARLLQGALNGIGFEVEAFSEFKAEVRKAIRKLGEVEEQAGKNASAIHGIIVKRGKEGDFWESIRDLINRQGRTIASLTVWKQKKSKEIRTLENCFQEHTSLLTKLGAFEQPAPKQKRRVVVIGGPYKPKPKNEAPAERRPEMKKRKGKGKKR